MALTLLIYYQITICKTSLLSSLIWVVLLCQAIFYDVSHSFFSSYNREKVLKILDILLQTKDSDNAESISIAKWQGIFGIITAIACQTWTHSCDSYSEYLIIYFDYLIIPFDYLITG